MHKIIKKLENEGYIIYYMDTDSIAINKPLPKDLVGPELGKFKLEHVLIEGLFLNAKVYAGKAKDYEFGKVKGYKNPVSFDMLKTLLDSNNNLELEQEKWYKDTVSGLRVFGRGCRVY